MTKPWFTNTSDWSLRDAEGVHYSSALDSGPKDLTGAELSSGQQNTGTMAFDAPATGSELSYQENIFDGETAFLPLVG